MARLEAAHSMDVQPADDWRALWLNNPLWPRLGDRWPIGWVLEDEDGRLVGSVVSIPSLYRFRGRELICAVGRAWVVAAEYRGYALWLMSEYFEQPGVDLFFNTTVGPNATELHGTFSRRVPLGDWEAAAFWVTGYRGFARRVLEKVGAPLPEALAFPAGAALRLKDALFVRRLPAIPSSVTIELAGEFDPRFDEFWEELVRQQPDRLLAARDSRTLTWHYAVPVRRRRLWTYTASRGGLLRAYCVLKVQDMKAGLRALRLVDYQTVDPDVDLLPALLRQALRRAAAEGFHLFEHLGTGLPKMHSLDRLAPYRRQLPNWAFFGHATDPALDAELRRPEAWDPSAYDGDASFE